MVVLDQVPFLGAADRVRPVQHHQAFAVFGGRLEGVGHRPDVGVVAGADVLEVEDQGVEILQHRLRGPAGGAVEAADRDSLPGVGDLHQVLFHRVEPVFRGEERGEPDAGQGGDHLPGVAERGVHRGRVRDEPDGETAQQLAGLRQPVEPGADGGFFGRGGGLGGRPVGRVHGKSLRDHRCGGSGSGDPPRPSPVAGFPS